MKYSAELDLSIPMKHSWFAYPVSKFSIFIVSTFFDDDSIKRLLLGCPVLDELSMNQCGADDVRVFRISAHVLTKLRFCKQKDTYYDELSEYKIMIDK